MTSAGAPVPRDSELSDAPGAVERSGILSLKSKVGYAAGLSAANSSASVFGVLANPLFNIVLGVSPAAIGAISFLQRIWGVAIDPIAGHFSDGLRTRWGRRRPLLLAASLPLGLAFAAIWLFPGGTGPTHLLLYLLGTSLIFYTIHAFYMVPMIALGMECTDDYHERTRLNAFAQICAFFILIAIQWAFPLIQLRGFSTVVEGSRCFAIGFAGLIVPLAALPFFLNREPLYPSVVRRGREPFRDSLRQALANRPFRKIAAAQAAYSFTYNLVAVFGLYLNYYAVFRGDIRSAAIMQGWNGTIFQVSGIVSLLFLRRFALIRGKKEAVLLAIVVFGAGCVMKLFVYVPGHPWLQTIVYVTNGISAAGMTAPIDAMLADVADFDESTSGRRREGMYASVLAWFNRVGNAVGTLFSGFLLVWMGFDATRGGAQPAATLLWLRWAYFVVPALGACAVYHFLRKYPLDEKTCRAMCAELSIRRQKTA